MTDTTEACRVCGDAIDLLEDTHYRLGEEERPIPDADDMDTDDWFSRSWVVCWECVYTKFGLAADAAE